MIRVDPSMPDTLARIVAYKVDEVVAAKAATSTAMLEDGAARHGAPRGFATALQQRADAGAIGLIAEIKKASPSKGLIRADFDPSILARAYEAGGATCLSVLTDGPGFQGDDSYLAAARDACALPCLRKDFMIDPWQVMQSRMLGADAILVIMACVDDNLARDLIETAHGLGMDALVETHDRAEMDRALRLPATLIGINNRNLRSFETRLDTTEALAPLVPSDRLIVAESGINTPGDIARLGKVGARVFLVGESLMRQQDVEHATRTLLS
jgi:indole-3-glycerol phosphate synthase